MKAIHANPKEVRKLFTDEFIVPDFQRPYSWNKEECENLWDDLIEFIEQKPQSDEKYFLGNIVIHEEGKAFVVIDGQQRLTTLLLLIKSLFARAGVVHALEKCLKKEDPLTAKLVNELRVESKVLASDKNDLYDLVFNNGKNLQSGRFLENYRLFQMKLEKWIEEKNNDPNALNNLILVLLDQVVILPIHCGSEDDALTIFETINNRGVPLTDADIFKAKLHASSGADKDEFLESWNRIENHEWLFRIHMHILRAKASDTAKEKALRTYFTKDNLIKRDWRTLMKSLETYYEITNSTWADGEIYSYWGILSTYPNYYWNYPLFVFLHKHGNFDRKNGFTLPANKIDSFKELIKEAVKYYFIKGVVHNSVNAVKDTTFRVCSKIEQDSGFIEELRDSRLTDIEEFERRLRSNFYGRYLRGLVLLGSLLNEKQKYDDFYSIVLGQYHIEHILPKKWNDYDNWTDELWTKNIDTLGNLVPLEWKLNISAQNEFFQKKKNKYLQSKVQDVLELSKINQWYPEDLLNRHEKILQRLLDFAKL